MKGTLLIFLVQIYLMESTAKRIVLFPYFQASHITTFVKVAEALADLKHETWVCVPQFTYDRNIIKVDKVKLVPYGQKFEDKDNDFFTKTGLLENFWHGSKSFFQIFSSLQEYMHNESYHIFTSPSLISALEDTHPDYFVLDTMPLFSNSLALPYKFKVPFSVLGAAYNIIGARVPFSPVALPSMLFPGRFSSETTFLQRLQKTFGYFLMLTDPVWNPRIAEVLVPGETPPSSSRSLIQKADLHLVENDVILGYSYPQLANTIMIGGTSAIPAKKLPEKFEHIMMKNSQIGVVLVSFGSSVANFPPEIAIKIFAALKELPFHVVWRVNLTSPDENKITTSTWIPQNDLLGYNDGKTVKVFVSHCGAWGQYEALYHAVPILCLPIFSDQPFNAHRIHDKGFGTFADIRTVSANELSSLILEVASNETYRNNIRTASELFKELYKSPTKTAAYWLDHVMKYGSKHLRAAGQDMPAYQLLLLDVLGFLGIIFIIVSVLLFSLIRFCCTKCCRKSKSVKTTKKE